MRFNADELYPNYFERDQLYNLKTDPMEQNNLAKDPEYNEILTEMNLSLTAYVKEFPHRFGEFT